MRMENRKRNSMAKLILAALLAGSITGTAYAADTTVGTGSGIAYGTGTVSTNDTDVAIGNQAQGTGGHSIAIGSSATATAEYAVAIGAGSTASGQNGIAFGQGSTASGQNGIAIGQGSTASGQNGIAIGNNTWVSVANGVAIGANSSSSTAAGAIGYLARTNTDATWKSTLGAVSIGDSGMTRQIHNVAAGTTDTDAVNVAQLQRQMSNSKFTVSDNVNSGTVALGDTLRFTAGSNATVAYDTTSKTVTFGLANNLVLDSVTVGGIVINSSGINAGGLQVTDVASGIGNNTNLANIGDVNTIINNAVTSMAAPTVTTITNNLTNLGMDFVGNDSTTVHRNLGTTLKVEGGLTGAALASASTTNIGTRANAAGDGLDIVMSDTPTFTSVTAGTVGGLTNTTWSGTAVTGRAATEDQLGAVSTVANNAAAAAASLGTSKADVNAGNLSPANVASWQSKLGVTGLTAQVSGNTTNISNLQNAVNTLNGGFTVSDGTNSNAVHAGDTLTFAAGSNATVAYNTATRTVTYGVNPNLTLSSLTVGPTTINASGINAGGQAITNVASGGTTTTNVATIGDVNNAIANANSTLTTTITNNLTNLGMDFVGNDSTTVHRNLGTTLKVEGGLTGAALASASTTNIGTRANAAGDGLDIVMSDTPTFTSVTAGTVGGLTNTTWSGTAVTGRAATEDQLGVVDTKVNNNTSLLNTLNSNLSNLTTQVTNNTNAINTLLSSSGGFTVSDGTNSGLISAGNTLTFGGYNYVDVGYNATTRTVSIGIDATTKAKLDTLFTTPAPTPGTLIPPSTNLTVNSVTANAVTANTYSVGGNTYISSSGLNANNQTINNVAPGAVTPNSTQAVNGAQLYQVQNAVSNISSYVDGLESKAETTGALGAAMASLKPLQYDPMSPGQLMFGIGYYKDKAAVAMGYAHYLNENTMVHVGASTTDEDQMYNAGVTWRFGRSADKTKVPERYKAGAISSIYLMQDEMTAVKDVNARLTAENEELKAKAKERDAQIAAMKAQLEALMAQG